MKALRAGGIAAVAVAVALSAPASAEAIRCMCFARAASAAATPPPVPQPGIAVSDTLFSLHAAPDVVTVPGVPAARMRLWDVHTSWAELNPAPGEFDWRRLDERIALAEAGGSTVLLVLGLTPPWAGPPTDADDRWGDFTAAMPDDPGTFAEYVTQVMRRYGGRIDAVEVWNEADLQTFFTGTPGQMADLTRLAYDVVKSISPATKVMAASTTIRRERSLRYFYAPYLEELKRRGWPVDGFTLHSYPDHLAGPVERYRDALAWRAVLESVAGDEPAVLARPVWDTEINYGLPGGGENTARAIDDATGAAYLARTYVDSVRLGLQSTFWYIWTAKPFDVIGVQLNASTPASIRAYDTVRSWLTGSRMGDCVTIEHGAIECPFSRGAERFSVVFANRDATPFSRAGQTATFIDGTSAPSATVTSVGIAPVRLAATP